MKRVWNIVNPSIYSLSSFDNEGGQNFNICSYVSVVSLKPKLYMIAIEKKSKTYSNLSKSSSCILQILSIDNINLVKSLGKKSGWNINKLNFLNKKEMLELWNGKKIIKKSCGVIFLEKTNQFITTGDHALFIFKILKAKTFKETNILTFNNLIEKKIIL